MIQPVKGVKEPIDVEWLGVLIDDNDQGVNDGAGIDGGNVGRHCPPPCPLVIGRAMVWSLPKSP